VALLEKTATYDAFVEANFSGFPEQGPLSLISQAYVDAFNPLQLAANAENRTKVIKERWSKPLRQKLSRLRSESIHRQFLQCYRRSSAAHEPEMWRIVAVVIASAGNSGI
jgi:hypothetical protein